MSVILLLAAQSAAAASLTLAWDPEPAVAGYVVSYGTQSGVYTNSLNAGPLQTSQQITGLADGTMYYFIVRAYDSAGTLSPPSPEVSGMTPGLPSLPPQILCPAPVASSTDGKPVVVTFSASVYGGTPPITGTCSPASGSLFPVGSTPATCTATDAVNLSASCSTSVVVTYSPPVAPVTPLAIMCPAPSATSSDGRPVVVTFSATASGGTAPVSSSCAPASGSLFPVGTTPLSCTAVDAKQSSASCSSSVTVTSTALATSVAAPLAISCPLIAPVISHSGNAVKVLYSPTVTGGVAPVIASCQPASGSAFPIGNTAVTCTATDSQQHVDSCATSVIVTGSGSSSPALSGVPTEFDALATALTGKCPTETFKAGAVSVTTGNFTNFAKGSCSALANGKKVHVQGLVQPDTTVVATAITFVK